MSQDKLKPLDEVATIRRELREQGKKVAHCHGAFDLLHPGHIHHLQAARSLADVLIVTLTEDQFIRKGPGRPVFNERLRSATIAALECVGHVAMSPWPTAVETLEIIRPDLYVKGQDYRDRRADPTGAIIEEERIVEKYGGKMVCTDEIQFSSTRLLNQHFDLFNDEQREFLSQIQHEFGIGDVLARLDQLLDKRVLVVGEAIIDEYHYCLPDAMSNKTPTISARFESAECYPGGVEAVGRHLAGLTATVDVLAGTGTDGYAFESATGYDAAAPMARLTTVARPDGPTVRKRRFVHRFSNQKLFELTFLNDRRIPEETEQLFLQAIDELAPQADVVIVADFGHGFMTPAIVERLRERSKFLAVNAQINSSNRGFNNIRKYRNADYMSIDEYEIRLPFGDRYGELEKLIAGLADESGCRHINVTLGDNGTLYFNGEKCFKAPVFTSGVVDAIGAGDALLAITAMLVESMAPPILVPFIGNCMGGLMTQIVGHRCPVDATNLKKFITTLMK